MKLAGWWHQLRKKLGFPKHTMQDARASKQTEDGNSHHQSAVAETPQFAWGLNVSTVLEHLMGSSSQSQHSKPLPFLQPRQSMYFSIVCKNCTRVFSYIIKVKPASKASAVKLQNSLTTFLAKGLVYSPVRFKSLPPHLRPRQGWSQADGVHWSLMVYIYIYICKRPQYS